MRHSLKDLPLTPIGRYLLISGILLENAGNIVLNLALDQNEFPDIEDENFLGLEWSLEKMAKAGITSLVDAR